MKDILQIFKTDVFRYTGNYSFKSFLRAYMLTSGVRFMFWHRIAHSARNNKLLYIFPRIVLSRLKYKYGYDIPAETKIGKGFYIGHFGGIVVSPKSVIGCNVNISQGVTIGFNSRGKRKGYPTIGNNVYIGPSAKIIGNVKVGENSAIGANAVVTDDIPEFGVVTGIPAKLISQKGSEGYNLNKIDY